MLKELDKPIAYLKGVGPKRSELYGKLGVSTVYELICHYPRDYIDYTSPVPIKDAPQGEACAVRGTVVKKLQPAMLRRGLTVYKAVVTDGESDLVVTFYNNGYMFDSLLQDKEYCFYGKITGSLIRKEVNSPLVVSAESGELVQPVYRLTEGLSQNMLRQNMRNALSVFDNIIYEPLTNGIKQAYGLCSLEYALENIHFPKDMYACGIAHKRLAFDEFLTLQLGLLTIKNRGREQSGCKMRRLDISEFYGKLPFELTRGQSSAVEDCIRDMCAGNPMNRLVQGDVGSGKTAVAAAVAYFACKNEYQTALMAPTEILAAQHYDTLKSFLGPLGINVVLLTGSLSPKKKKEVKEGLKNGDYAVAVGTHALVEQSTGFKKLGLVITDEQHRFGVAQRGALAGKGDDPHKLVMSATPIPRTLALMMYGDLDISVLKELPKGRQPVETFAVRGKLRERAFNFVKKQLDEGRQGYIVCPAVEESESDLKDVKTYAQEIRKGAFKDYKVGLLHGKLKGADKDKVMLDFKEGRIDLLVSTTVVEVGVDVPNAAFMIIENADRFGFSQLHQLRGRVGRGKFKSYCILITDNVTEDVLSRMKTICSTNDGFKISEEDLKLRGSGDFFGSRQHGLPKLKIGNFSEDFEILRSAQDCAKKILEKDPELERAEHACLKERVKTLFDKHLSDN